MAVLHRLLAPQGITKLVRDQNDARAIDVILGLVRPNFVTTDQAVAAGAPVRLVDAGPDGRKAPIRQPEPYLLL